jgi:hypothetical protein
MSWLVVTVAAIALSGCGAGSPPVGSPIGRVGFLDAVVTQSPRADGAPHACSARFSGPWWQTALPWHCLPDLASDDDRAG